MSAILQKIQKIIKDLYFNMKFYSKYSSSKLTVFYFQNYIHNYIDPLRGFNKT